MYFQTCVSGTPSLLAATVTTHGLVTHCSGLGNSQSESTDWTRTTGTVREELERKKIFFFCTVDHWRNVAVAATITANPPPTAITVLF